ncbi:MAG: methanogen output domain 1-containing protein [Pelagibaca sp.]
MRSVIRELTGILQDTVGEKEAAAYVNHVGTMLAGALNAEYRRGFETPRLNVQQVAAALVHLKARIDGGFSIQSLDKKAIVLVNNACPFGDKVLDRPALCRMTANVFGRIAAENLGYARVRIDEAIARGDARCLVIVGLDEAAGAAGDDETEFFKSES